MKEVDLMNPERVKQLEGKLRDLRAAKADLKPVLTDALAKAADVQERAFILSRLASEWQLEIAKLPFSEKYKHKFDQAERAIRECIALEPNEPYHWIRLAEYFHIYAGDLEQATKAIDTAIKSAAREGAFVRQAHGTRIRIALETKDYAGIEQSLTALLEYIPPTGSPDVAMESDFLSGIPAGSVDPKLVERYRATVNQ